MADVLRPTELHDSNSSSKDQLRKTKKPLMEKRRRARINSCLNDIKSLLLQAFNKDGSQFSKLEKADILEMTVKYLRSMQQAQLSAAVQADHAVTSRYRAGFTECAKETLRYVDNPHISEGLRSRLTNHLNNCVQAINTPSVHQTPVTPVYVQIPSYTIHEQTPSHYIVPHTPPSPPHHNSNSDSDYSTVNRNTHASGHSHHSCVLRVCKQEVNENHYPNQSVSPVMSVQSHRDSRYSPVYDSHSRYSPENQQKHLNVYRNDYHISNDAIILRNSDSRENNVTSSFSPNSSVTSSPRRMSPSPISDVSPATSPALVSPTVFTTGSKICRDVVCTEHVRSSDKSQLCRVRSMSPSEPVWRPW